MRELQLQEKGERADNEYDVCVSSPSSLVNMSWMPTPSSSSSSSVSQSEPDSSPAPSPFAAARREAGEKGDPFFFFFLLLKLLVLLLLLANLLQIAYDKRPLNTTEESNTDTVTCPFNSFFSWSILVFFWGFINDGRW